MLLKRSGLLVIKIYDYFSKYSRKFSYFEWIVYSLPTSFILYFVTTLVLSSNFDLNEFLFYYMGFFLFTMVIVADIVMIIKYFFRSNYTTKDAWDLFAATYVKQHILINTIDQKRYQGYLKHATINYEKIEDVILGDPKLLDDDETIPLGHEMFFPMKTIHSILPLVDNP